MKNKIKLIIMRFVIGKPIGFGVSKKTFEVEGSSSLLTKQPSGRGFVKKGDKFVLCKSVFGKSLIKGSLISPKLIIPEKLFLNFKLCTSKIK